MFDQKIFQERLKQIRIANELTLERFGKLFGIANQSVSKWEKGINLPSINLLVAISEHFNVSIDYLLGVSDNPKRKWYNIKYVSLLFFKINTAF